MLWKKIDIFWHLFADVIKDNVVPYMCKEYVCQIPCKNNHFPRNYERGYCLHPWGAPIVNRVKSNDLQGFWTIKSLLLSDEFWYQYEANAVAMYIFTVSGSEIQQNVEHERNIGYRVNDHPCDPWRVIVGEKSNVQWQSNHVHQ